MNMENNIVIYRTHAGGRAHIYTVLRSGKLIAHGTPLLSLAAYWAYQHLDASSKIIYAWRT